MSTIEIRQEDIRPGDHVTIMITEAPVEALIDPSAGRWQFIRATREVPDLPTEPGSVIVNATIRGAVDRVAVLDVFGDWYDPHAAIRIQPEEITAWTPARIVPEDGAS